jgi:NADPH-dependent glutamate synthase beta subunit-like oxidoreductase
MENMRGRTDSFATFSGDGLDEAAFEVELTEDRMATMICWYWIFKPPISAARKHVVVIGGGDTGSDCIGTAIRQGALSVTNFEIMPKPPEKEDKLLTWPNWPLKLRTSSSHEEGAERDFAVMTQKFTGQHGQVQTLECVRCDDKFKPGT